MKTVEGDPEFDTKRAKKKLRRYVEGHDHAIGLKAEIMVDHFHEQVIDLRQDRRRSPGDGGHGRDRARDPIFPRDSEPISKNARAPTRRSWHFQANTSMAGEGNRSLS